jgi:hypothetical protein
LIRVRRCATISRFAPLAQETTRMASSVYSRTFQKAAQLVGGPKKLARQLRVPLAELEKWLADKGEPPMPFFLKAVDLVLDETAASPGSEPGEPTPPRDCAPVGGNSYLL